MSVRVPKNIARNKKLDLSVSSKDVSVLLVCVLCWMRRENCSTGNALLFW